MNLLNLDINTVVCRFSNLYVKRSCEKLKLFGWIVECVTVDAQFSGVPYEDEIAI